MNVDNFIEKVKSTNKANLTQAEIFALVLQCQQETNKLIQCGNITMNKKTYEVKVGENKPIRLEFLTYNLLVYLIGYKNECVDRNTLLKNVWGANVFVTSRSVDVAIWKVRQIIGNEKVITIKKVGYMFVD
jgi:DNA-binding response OmpR family regulator